ncbi:MAG: nitrile hydratase beta subunit [Candidatus Azotimanducaceae bacterium]|jgi:nitrile hydratase beta subunit
MDGIHDLGGKHGFGSVQHEQDEPVFHAHWEAKMFAIMRSSGPAGAWYSADRFRHLVERIDPISYLDDGYYGRWLGAVETGLIEAGVLHQADIQQRYLDLGGDPSVRIAARPVDHPDPMGDLPGGAGSQRSVPTPLFKKGDEVVTSTDVKPGHTRLPAYARGKVGRVVQCHAGWVFPDTNAHGEGEQPQNLYTVEFSGQSLWGDSSEAMSLCLDLFEPYLSRPFPSEFDLEKSEASSI